MSDTASWQAIEREARDQVRAALVAEEGAPLEYGHTVAWVECSYGRTDSLGRVHRAGATTRDGQLTLCGEEIPAALLRLPLTPNFAASLGRCRRCDDVYVEKRAAA